MQLLVLVLQQVPLLVVLQLQGLEFVELLHAFEQLLGGETVEGEEFALGRRGRGFFVETR